MLYLIYEFCKHINYYLTSETATYMVNLNVCGYKLCSPYCRKPWIMVSFLFSKSEEFEKTLTRHDILFTLERGTREFF